MSVDYDVYVMDMLLSFHKTNDHSIFVLAKAKNKQAKTLTIIEKRQREVGSCSLFSEFDSIQHPPPDSSSSSTGLNKKLKTSDGTAAACSANIYGKWTGLAQQHPEKYVYHHDYLPFIAQPLGRVLIRLPKKINQFTPIGLGDLTTCSQRIGAGITLKGDHLSSSLYLNRSLCQKRTENMFWQLSQW